MTTDVKDLFGDTELDAIAIATPVSTHFDLAQNALMNNKHVWIEKPMTERTEQAEALIKLAEKKRKKLIVDHTFIYTGAVQKMKELISNGDIGDPVYFDSTRVNLGLFQQDIDVIWDLAAHDLSIMDHLLPLKKLTISATGSNFYGEDIVAKSLLTIYLENNVIGHINVSWVSPVKIRQTLVGGTSKIILWDDNNPSEKVKIYDKGVELFETKEDLYHLKVQYRVGDMHAPCLNEVEALGLETEHFADCILNDKEPKTNGESGLKVVKVLVASKESLKRKGAPVELA